MTAPSALARRMAPYLATLFLGAFNDNLIKNAVILFILFTLGGAGGLTPETLVPVAAGLFILPYVLFSALAGELADRADKARMMRWIKAAEIPIMALASVGLFAGSTELLLTALFLMGTQSAFFSPCKYGWLPDSLPRGALVAANGWVEASTFLAILLGSIAGGVLISTGLGVVYVAGAVLAVAVAGLTASFFIPRAGAKSPGTRAGLNAAAETCRVLKDARADRRIWLTILGISWFWAVGSVLLSQIPVFAKDVLAGDELMATLFVGCATVGIGLGSLLAGWLARGEVTVKFVPLAALAMAGFAWLIWAAGASDIAGAGAAGVAAFLADPASWWLVAGFVGFTVAGGVYIVPLNAWLQAIAPEARRSRTIAADNILNALAMAVSSGLVAGLFALGLDVLDIFLVVALASVAVALHICRLLPSELVKGVAAALCRVAYGLKVRGLENAPEPGRPAVYVANHASLIDGGLLAASLPGEPLFAVDRTRASTWWIKPFLWLTRAYPVDSASPLAIRAMAREVAKGEHLVIFPEGRLTRTGGLMKIYDGPGLIAEKAGAEIVPVVIAGAEASTFSRLAGKLRRHVFPSVTITLLPPRRLDAPAGLSARERRLWASRALYDVMSEAAFEAAGREETLFEAVLDARATHGGGSMAIEDPTGRRLSYNRLVAGALALGRALRPGTRRGEAVGVLLPTSAAAAVAFLALQATGRVPALLNFTSGAAALRSASTASGLRRVITARAFVERAKLHDLIAALPDGVETVYLEDFAAGIGAFGRLRALAALPFARWRHRRLGLDPNGTAVILFTSGSEGTPKGVALSHMNLLANCRQVAARLDFTPADRVMNALPMFHAFGLTGGFLLPLISGVASYLYPSPLHSRIVPELIYDRDITIFFATDTFLNAWARRANDYDFHAARHIFAGAEKLRDETRRLYMDRFGKRVLEGYGVTECAPVVALNTPMHNKPGSVGRFVPGLEARLEPVEGIAAGGRLFVRGPNVMLGYLTAGRPGEIVAPPGGWHDTGDIVEIDAAGFVTILDRAKRFAKVGGEMVSLGAVEAAVARRFPEAGHAVCALADPRKGEQLVLATTQAGLDRAAVAEALRDAGLPDLAVPRRIATVETLPLTGTGKVDYRALAATLTEGDETTAARA